MTTPKVEGEHLAECCLGEFLRNGQQAGAAHKAITRDDGVEALLRHNREFHFLVYGASGSEVLTQLIGLLWLRFGPYLRMLSRALEARRRFGLRDVGSGSKRARAGSARLRLRSAIELRGLLL